MKQYHWSVIGAGPAGILAVGKLLDQGVKSSDILWLDPAFNVGALGQYWYRVPSNTKVRLFTEFLLAASAFDYVNCPHSFDHLDPDGTCLLADVVKPLQWVTQRLRKRVHTQEIEITELYKTQQGWCLSTHHESWSSNNVILATGAIPKQAPSQPLPCIDLPTVLNPEKLAQVVSPKDTVIVYGASHSGVLAVKNLLNLDCSVINTYKHPLRYAIYQSDHIIYDNTGLKGVAADFARAQMETTMHPKLTRCLLASADYKSLVAQANKAVYAVGFVTHQRPHVANVHPANYDPQTGIIALGLFGCGIAFPERVTDRYGHQEWNVGLFKFARYLERVLPIWLAYTH